MPMYNLMEYNDAYSKTSGSLWQYNRDEPALDNNGNIADYNNNNFLIITIIVLHSILNKKKNRTNRKRRHKRSRNSGSIKISK